MDRWICVDCDMICEEETGKFVLCHKCWINGVFPETELYRGTKEQVVRLAVRALDV